MKVVGTHGEATVLQNEIADDALRSLKNLLNHRALAGQKIVVMPDVHYAGPCPVGFTSTFAPENGIIPAVIGGDIGCGLLQLKYAGVTDLLLTEDKKEQFCTLLQSAIEKNISYGQELTQFGSDGDEKQWLRNAHSFLLKYVPQPEQFEDISIDQFMANYQSLCRRLKPRQYSLKSLGSGNHFIELSDHGELTVHCGSRALGQGCYQYYLRFCQSDDEPKYSFEQLFCQNILGLEENQEVNLAQIDPASIATALQQAQDDPVYIRTCYFDRFKADLIHFMKTNTQLRACINSTLRRLEKLDFTQGDLNAEFCQLGTLRDKKLVDQYLLDMRTCAQYATLNRASIQLAILTGLLESRPELHIESGTESVHNAIYRGVMRKGAIYAGSGKTILVPLNPSQGIAICRGTSSSEFNFSAPHGTGRKLSKKQVNELQRAKGSDVQFGMDGIFQKWVGPNSVSECPVAYRNLEQIQAFLERVADVVETHKPIFSFKAGK